MPVCARDTGIYLGFLSALGLFILGRRYESAKAPDRWVIGFAAVGLCLYAFDALSSYLGFRSTTNDIRLLAGLAFGTGIAFLLLSVASTVMFKGNVQRRAFTWRDIAIILPVLAIVSVPFLTDLGPVAYYIMAAAVIAGYLLMLFLMLVLLVSILRSWSLVDSNRYKLLLTTVGLEIVMVSVLWISKHYAWAAITIPD